MKALFIHHHFPGPFRHLAVRLASLPGVTVLFLSERGRREVRLPKVRRLGIAGPSTPPEGEEADREMASAMRRGANTANALLRLRRDGFIPDLIYAGAGFGNSLYVRDIFPESCYAVHADWFHRINGPHTFFTKGAPRPPVDFAPGRIRNLFQFNALAECDLAVTSTEWQRSQYPEGLAERIHVMHEGVDADFFSPLPGEKFAIPECDLSHAAELVTFSGRGTLRGLPQVCRAAPRILAERPQCHLLFMISTPGQPREKTVTVLPEPLSALLAFLRREQPEAVSRVHVCGFLPPDAYRSLLRASTVHVYMTAPFFLSLGLLEAMSCGCVVVGSDTEPVREVVRHGSNGFLCDFWDSAGLSERVVSLLEHKGGLQPMRDAARETVLSAYDTRKLLPAHLKLLSETMSRHKADT